MRQNTLRGDKTPERFESRKALTTDCPVCGTPIEGFESDARTTVEPCGHAATQLTTHMMTSTTDSDTHRVMTDGGTEQTSYRVTCTDCEMSETYSQEDIAIGRKLAHADVRGHRVDVQQVATDGGIETRPLTNADTLDQRYQVAGQLRALADRVEQEGRVAPGAEIRIRDGEAVVFATFELEDPPEVMTDGGSVPAADSDLYDPEDGFHTCPDCDGDCQYQSPVVVVCLDCETEFSHFYSHDGTNNLFRAPDNEHAAAVYDPADDRRGEVMTDGGEEMPSGDTLAGGLLTDTAAVVTESRESHGDAVQNQEHIAEAWDWYLDGHGLLADGASLTGSDVARMMQLLKLSRGAVGDFDIDHDRDVAGYAGIAAACEVAAGNAAAEEVLPDE